MDGAEIVTATRLKIKFSSKTIEAVTETSYCKSAKRLPLVNKETKDSSFHDDCHFKRSSSTFPDSKKRGPSWTIDGQKEKRQKMDRSSTQTCTSLVKELIRHKAGWIFAKPVDPVVLKIPDYFSVITHPMDLGTIKSRLEKNLYACPEEIAADIRLTFSNAMLYNPPGNEVHIMAKLLNDYFETRWKSLEERWNRGRVTFGSGQTKEYVDTKQNCPKTPPLHATALPKKLKPTEKNVVKLTKMVDNPVYKLIGKDSQKGTGTHTGGSVDTKQSLSSGASKCSTCGGGTCRCSLSSDSARASSDISFERSTGGDQNPPGTYSSKMDFQGKSVSASDMSKSDPDSDGAVSALDDGNICPNSHCMSPATDATSEEGWRPTFDVQLSPTKALRAAMLKKRFADTILKAQHKTLLDHGDKDDILKMRQEKEKLERKQREEKVRIEAQLRAAEAASRMKEEIELKRQREKEREASRIALQQMERTVEIEENLKIFRELEVLCGCSLTSFLRLNSKQASNANGYNEGELRSPLGRLGLFMKDDFEYEDDMLEADGEEGEIIS